MSSRQGFPGLSSPMPAAIDATGQRYGRLVAMDFEQTNKGRVWRFVCDCGNEIRLPLGRVRIGTTRSCGCLRREVTRAKKTVDLIGLRFGRLVVARKSDIDDYGKVRWAAICDCGGIKETTTTSLRRGVCKSCGCLQREVAAKSCRARKKANPVSVTPEYRRAIRAKRRENPIYVMQARISRLFRHSLARIGALKTSNTFAMLGYTPTDLVAHIERQFLPRMGWHNISKWQIDHIVPASLAKASEDVLRLNQLSNLRPMWSAANNAKKDRIEFLL